MSRSANSIFTPTNLDTFEVPIEIFDRLLASSDEGANTILVYLYILRRAMSDGPLVRFHTGDALNDLGISRPVFIKARKALCAVRLIRAKETEKQGVWQYEIRDPKGKKLPTHDDYVVFADLTAAQLEAYYADRLGVARAPGKDASGNPVFMCPFHTSTRNRPTMRVTVDKDRHHGRFICGESRRCGKRGGLVDFEIVMAKRKGVDLNRWEASSSVRAFMMSNGTEAQNPIVADLLKNSSAVTL